MPDPDPALQTGLHFGPIPSRRRLRLFEMVLAVLAGVFLARGWQGPVILLPDQIAGEWYDEIPGEVLGVREWMGLFPGDSPGDTTASGSRFHLSPADVRFAPFAGAPTPTWRVQTAPQGARMLLAGVPALESGPVVRVGGERYLWRDRPEVEYLLGGRTWTIRLEGTPETCDAVIRIESGGVRQVLLDARQPDPRSGLAGMSCDEPHFEIHWAGDLDGDGHLDLVTTLSRKYSYHPVQVWLSSRAEAGDLMIEVARYDRFSA